MSTIRLPALITSRFLRERPKMVPAATRIVPVPQDAVDPLRRMKNFMNKRNANAAAYRRYLNQMKAMPAPNNGFRTPKYAATPNTSTYVSPLSVEPAAAAPPVYTRAAPAPAYNRATRNRLVRNITRRRLQQKEKPWWERLANTARRSLFGGKRTRR